MDRANRDLEALLELCLLETQELARQDQMPSGGNRQELGEPLDHPENNGLQQRHGALFKLKAMRVVAVAKGHRRELFATFCDDLFKRPGRVYRRNLDRGRLASFSVYFVDRSSSCYASLRATVCNPCCPLDRASRICLAHTPPSDATLNCVGVGVGYEGCAARPPGLSPIAASNLNEQLNESTLTIVACDE